MRSGSVILGKLLALNPVYKEKNSTNKLLLNQSQIEDSILDM